MLNLGCGPATGDRVRTIKGEVSRIIGADIDPLAARNDEIDEFRLVSITEFPFEPETFDLVLSDFVLEHVEHPLPFLQEVCRVVKRGGCFMFRTPNRNHYVAVVSRILPHRFHRLADIVRNTPEGSHEPWPTFYRINTRRQVKQCGALAGFKRIELRMIEAEPSYLMFSRSAFRLGVLYERMVNRSDGLAGLRANILGKLVK